MTAEKTKGVFSTNPDRERREIVLPSGRAVTVLETTGEAERLLSSLQQNRDLSIINRFLSLVTEDLDGKQGHPSTEEFNAMLTGDRTFILLNSRLLTHGHEVRFRLDCASCGAKSEHEIDLNECLETMEPYPSGDQRDFCVPIGPGKVHFALSTGETELRIARVKNPEINTKLRCMKVWEETDQGRIPVNLDVFKSSWIAELRLAVRNVECKLDTTVRIKCPDCGTMVTADIMGNLDFLFPHST